MAEKSSAAPFIPAEHTLPILAAAEPLCKGCDPRDHEQLYHYLRDDLARAYAAAMGKHDL